MGRIERGEVNLTLEKIYELAKALEVPIIELLPDSDQLSQLDSH